MFLVRASATILSGTAYRLTSWYRIVFAAHTLVGQEAIVPGPPPRHRRAITDFRETILCQT
jgi:hypothetical protein